MIHPSTQIYVKDHGYETIESIFRRFDSTPIENGRIIEFMGNELMIQNDGYFTPVEKICEIHRDDIPFYTVNINTWDHPMLIASGDEFMILYRPNWYHSNDTNQTYHLRLFTALTECRKIQSRVVRVLEGDFGDITEIFVKPTFKRNKECTNGIGYVITTKDGTYCVAGGMQMNGGAMSHFENRKDQNQFLFQKAL